MSNAWYVAPKLQAARRALIEALNAFDAALGDVRSGALTPAQEEVVARMLAIDSNYRRQVESARQLQGVHDLLGGAQ